MAVAKKDTKESAGVDTAPAKKRVLTDFPKRSLEDAVRVAEAIESANAGQPYPRQIRRSHWTSALGVRIGGRSRLRRSSTD